MLVTNLICIASGQHPFHLSLLVPVQILKSNRCISCYPNHKPLKSEVKIMLKMHVWSKANQRLYLVCWACTNHGCSCWMVCFTGVGLDATGIGKLSTPDGKAFADPEVLRRLTSSVSCALDEAAAALTRMRAENTLNASQADK